MTPLRCSRTGGDLYYLSNADKMMVAEIRPSGSMIEVGVVRPFFEVKAKGQALWNDMTPDGQKFLDTFKSADSQFLSSRL